MSNDSATAIQLARQRRATATRAATATGIATATVIYASSANICLNFHFFVLC
jgi:hypothetical protein